MDQSQVNQPSYLQALPQDNSQRYSNLAAHAQGNNTNKSQENGAIKWAQNEFIIKTLEIETWKHNETRSELNAFRTQCFKLEQLLASEKAQGALMQNTIQDLRNKCHESTMGRMAAENRIQELQRNAASLAAAYTRIPEEGYTERYAMEEDTHFSRALPLESPLSSYKSATFSPSPPQLDDLQTKRKSPPDSRFPTSKRVKTDLSTPWDTNFTEDGPE